MVQRRSTLPVSVVIPTYGRDGVLLQTVRDVLSLRPAAQEVIVVDQTQAHSEDARRELSLLTERGAIRWVRLQQPSIPAAMNVGLMAAASEIVLFLDDDIVPGDALIGAHYSAHARGSAVLVAGRVIQPWHVDGSKALSGFAGEVPGYVGEFMGGNFSVDRDAAINLGGFDERFVRVAYRFEAEFAARLKAAGGRIWYEASAMIKHLKAAAGGTRTFGSHLTPFSANHTVGEYYFLMRVRPDGWLRRMLARPAKSVATRHHLRSPWWIMPSLIAELSGVVWAVYLLLRGPKYIVATSSTASKRGLAVFRGPKASNRIEK